MQEKKNENERRSFLVNTMVVGLGALGLSACSNDNKTTGNPGNPSDPGNPGTPPDGDNPGNGGGSGLNEEQLDQLFYIYQEEKVARDSYITLGNLYPQENTFAHIQLSEQRHIDAAQGLCETYGVDLSGVNEDSIGNFLVPVLQELYDTVIETGSQSLMDALDMAVLIENTDIDDLNHAIDDLGMPQDVIRVYENLREGSYNHLEAFQRSIATGGSTGGGGGNGGGDGGDRGM